MADLTGTPPRSVEPSDRATDSSEDKAERYVSKMRALYPKLDPWDAVELAAMALFEVDGRVHQRLSKLEARVAALEARKSMAVKGVWHPDAEYFEGDAATDRGSLWVCTRPTRGSRPGSDGSWTLAVKRGNV